MEPSDNWLRIQCLHHWATSSGVERWRLFLLLYPLLKVRIKKYFILDFNHWLTACKTIVLTIRPRTLCWAPLIIFITFAKVIMKNISYRFVPTTHHLRDHCRHHWASSSCGALLRLFPWLDFFLKSWWKNIAFWFGTVDTSLARSLFLALGHKFLH